MHIIGWDIGGAHLKAAYLQQGQISVYQQPCPLWKGLSHLQHAVQQILQDLPNAQHAITMTGELVDLFADRHDGVAQIIATMQNLLPNEVWVFAGSHGFIPVHQISVEHYDAIASANWLASASFAAQHVTDGLFLDIGSTTTDILLLQHQQVALQGYSDYQRLQTQELLYTGIVRTPVMAVAQTVIEQGQPIGLMAEYFATMADVYRLTGELNEAHDQTDTADGAEKTVRASARRLARMIGCDFLPEELARWQAFALALRQQQLQKIFLASQQRLSLAQHLPTNAPIIGAGVGRFLAQDVARLLGRDYVDFSALCPETLLDSALTTADCAPAVAVACLVSRFA